MTTIYKFHVRYYKTTKKGRKSYYVVTSPNYISSDICSEGMHDAIRQIISNEKYTIDSFWIETMLVDSIDLTKLDTFWTENCSIGRVNTGDDDDGLPF